MSSLNNSKFEAEWTQLGRTICQAVYENPKIHAIQEDLKKNGFLTLEQKSEFINICDTLKYEHIYATYGAENSEGYKTFSHAWQEWFQEKGVSSSQNRGQRNSVDHILFGSTPDPEQFLLHFEQEIVVE